MKPNRQSSLFFFFLFSFSVLFLIPVCAETLPFKRDASKIRKAEEEKPKTQVFTFPNGVDGWRGDFTDYPVGQEKFYELNWGWQELPTPIRLKDSTLKGGLYLSGNNHSDDLFMFVKKKIKGLQPNKLYAIHFQVIIESDVPAQNFGIGGSPGESLYFKVGGAPIEPIKVARGGEYFLNLDKGDQSQGGENALVIGNLANTKVDPQEPRFLPKMLSTTDPLIATASPEGELWVFLGTDSGFEGKTLFYIAHIELTTELLN